MLYPDSEKRIEIASDILNVFKSRGYVATAKEAETLIDVLGGSEFPTDLASKFNRIINVFSEEFKNSLDQFLKRLKKL
jgi:hypothetical protein